MRDWTANGQAVPVAPADDFGDLERILGIAGRLKDLGGPDAAVPEYEIVAFFDRVG